MQIPGNIRIRETSSLDDSLIAEHFYQMWRDNDVSTQSIRSNWLDITLQFIDRARRELGYQAFVAEVDGNAIGSVSCQLFSGLYPNILEEQYRKYGYIWGVYVEPSHRGQGIAKKLTLQACDYLKSIGCTRALLHASPSGKPVYDRLSFNPSNEMRLDL
jgi:ribosomal protein S18 acetylase RimI-like enzyme